MDKLWGVFQDTSQLVRQGKSMCVLYEYSGEKQQLNNGTAVLHV